MPQGCTSHKREGKTMTQYTFGSLFSGIGGLDSGLERAGFECVWQVENNAYRQEVLKKQWPNTPRFRDVRECGKRNLSSVDLIAGGFPCGDVSISNTRGAKGLDGSRSGLWSEFYRIVRELRPRYVLVENVSALLYRGFGRVLGDLAGIGYDAEWQSVQASDFGLPHQRKRIFIIAYTDQDGRTCFKNRHVQRGVSVHQRQTSDTMVLLRDMVAQLEQRLGEPSVLRNDDGLSDWMEQLEAIGDAVVPYVGEYVGQCIRSHMEAAA